MDLNNPEKVLKDSLKHVAVMGRFSWDNPGDKKTYSGEELRKLSFDLAYYTKTIEIGSQSTKYSSLLVCSPEEAANAVAGGFVKAADVKKISLDDNSALAKALSGTGGNAAEVGGKLFKQLLDALDVLARYWDPEFDRRLTKAAIRACADKGVGQYRVDGGVADKALKHPRANPVLLAYLRSPEDKALERLKDSLVLEQAVPAGQVDVIIEELRSMKKLLSEEGSIPTDPKLAKDYKQFREYAKFVEEFASCEPLIALVVRYMFAKVSEKEMSHEIAADLLGRVYRAGGREMAARLSMEKLEEDQVRFVDGMKSLQDLLKDELKTVYDVILADLAADRAAKWKPSSSFKRKNAADRNLRLVKELAIHAIDGVPQLINEAKKKMDVMKDIYRAFESMYKPNLTMESLAEAVLSRLEGDLIKSWADAFRVTHSAKSGTALGDAFRTDFNSEFGKILGGDLVAQLTTMGENIKGALSNVSRVYSLQLAPLVGQGSDARASVFIPLGGSLGGVDADKKQQEKVIRKAQRSRGAEVDLPADQAQKLKDADYADLLEAATGSATVKATLNKDLPETLSEGLKLIDDRLEEEVAKTLASADDFDRTKTAILQQILKPEDAGKAPARAQLRSLLLGEYLLGTSGDLSPLGKKDSSLGAHVVLEMVEKIGAAQAYEGANRSLLNSTEPDLECGVTKMALDGIWEVSVEEADRKVTEIVSYWLDISAKVFATREYNQDVQSVRNVAKAVGKAGGQMTMVNATAADHAQAVATQMAMNPLVALSHVSSAESLPPPGMVVVTRQAVPADWGLVEQKYQGKVLSFTCSTAGSGIASSVPLAIIVHSQPANPGWWPAIWLPASDALSIDPAWLVSTLLAAKAFPEKIGHFRFNEDWGQGQLQSFDDLGSAVLKKDAHSVALAASRILSYGLIRRALVGGGKPLLGTWLKEALVGTALKVEGLEYRSGANEKPWQKVPNFAAAVNWDPNSLGIMLGTSERTLVDEERWI